MYPRPFEGRLSCGPRRAARLHRIPDRPGTRSCSSQKSEEFPNHLDKCGGSNRLEIHQPIDRAASLPDVYFPPPSECTYTVSTLMVTGSRRPAHAGITPARPLVMVSTMVASSDPYSQIWSVRFGAPIS